MTRLDESSIFVIVLVFDNWSLKLHREPWRVHCHRGGDIFSTYAAEARRICPSGRISCGSICLRIGMLSSLHGGQQSVAAWQGDNLDEGEW